MLASRAQFVGVDRGTARERPRDGARPARPSQLAPRSEKFTGACARGRERFLYVGAASHDASRSETPRVSLSPRTRTVPICGSCVSRRAAKRDSSREPVPADANGSYIYALGVVIASSRMPFTDCQAGGLSTSRNSVRRAARRSRSQPAKLLTQRSGHSLRLPLAALGRRAGSLTRSRRGGSRSPAVADVGPYTR